MDITREEQLFVGWVSGSVTWAGVGFHASTKPTFYVLSRVLCHHPRVSPAREINVKIY